MSDHRCRRKRPVLAGAAMLVFLLLVPPALPASGAGPTVVLDPGHGGSDPGTVDEANGIFEKTINLQLARRTSAVLTDHGIRVLMTREDDELLCQANGSYIRRSIGPEDRVQVANTNAADLFFSLHTDISSDPARAGIVIHHFYLSEAGRFLAEQVEHAL